MLLLLLVTACICSIPTTDAQETPLHQQGAAFGPASDILNFTRLFFERGEMSAGVGLLQTGNTSYFTCNPELNTVDCYALIGIPLDKMVAGFPVPYCYPDLPLTHQSGKSVLKSDIAVKVAGVCGCYGVRRQPG